MTQEELSAKTDISVRTIQRIENGEVDARAYTLQAIANALEADFSMLNKSKRESDSGAGRENSKWLPLLHLSGLLLLIIPPILLWIFKRYKVENIQEHAYDVLNFQLSMSLYLIPCLMFSVYPFVVVLAVFSQVVIILNTVRVTNHRPYKYPLSINFLKQQVHV